MAARSPAAKPDSSSAAASGSAASREFAIGQPAALALAVGLDQADFRGPALGRGGQRGAQRFVLRQVEHGFPRQQLGTGVRDPNAVASRTCVRAGTARTLLQSRAWMRLASV